MRKFVMPVSLILTLGFLPVHSGWAQNNSATITQKLSDSIQCSLQLRNEPYFALTGVTGKPQQEFSRIFEVVVHQAGDTHVEAVTTPPAVLGRYEATDNELRFYPRFPLSDLVRYKVRLGPELQHLAAESEPLLFELPQTDKQPVQVTAVYPSAAVLPSNLLKFYIHFSGPMNRGEAYEQIQLLAGDEPVEGPFLELGEELWDPRQTRFTLFIHPGRIKRGLRSREEEGPAITSGREYRLKINSAWTSANGQPLASEFVKEFRVAGPDYDQPAPDKWQIKTPPKNTREPVRLLFDEPLDHAMLDRVLDVKNRNEEMVEGEIGILENETVWQFVPAEPWRVGAYHIEVAANLEDLSGNSIARPFEVKMQQGVAASPATRIAIEFIVK